MGLFSTIRAHWAPVDWIVAGYTAWMGVLIAWHATAVPQWPRLLTLHAGILAILFIIPPRGAPWEFRVETRPSLRALREFGRFVRYAYPLALALFFFEEGQFTVNMIHPRSPYWFEPHLYAADRALFGELPARLMAPWVTPPLTEAMHFFYWSYYIILIGGVAIAYVGRRSQNPRVVPAAGFDETIAGLATAFILAFLLYPWLAARGPWESPAAMAGLPPLEGWVFTWMMDRIIEHGAVSGNCFPSGHVAGAWAIVFGLAWTRERRRAAYLFAVLSAGMTIACVYTRYHHAVDLPAGFACGLSGAFIGGAVARRHRRRNAI